MNRWSDETLMAYADGELETALSAQLAERLARDALLARRLDTFVTTRAPLARAFEGALEEPVPARFQELLKYGPRYRPLSGVRSGWRRPAMAAAVVIGSFFGGWLSAQVIDDRTSLWSMSEGGQLAQGPLHAALERAASGTAFALGDSQGAALNSVFSFQSRDGRYCRQYRVIPQRGRGVAGVACRTTDGAWAIEVQAAFAPEPARKEQIVPAERPRTVIDRVVENLILGEVFTSEKERSLITRSWRAEP